MGYSGLIKARGEGRLLEDILKSVVAVEQEDILGGNVRSNTCLAEHVVCEAIWPGCAFKGTGPLKRFRCRAQRVLFDIIHGARTWLENKGARWPKMGWMP